MDALDVTMLTEEECIATPDSAVTDADIIDDSTSEEDKITYKDSTYEIVSKVAYLIGVPKRIFDNEHEAPKLDWIKLSMIKMHQVRFLALRNPCDNYGITI